MALTPLVSCRSRLWRLATKAEAKDSSEAHTALGERQDLSAVVAAMTTIVPCFEIKRPQPQGTAQDPMIHPDVRACFGLGLPPKTA